MRSFLVCLTVLILSPKSEAIEVSGGAEPKDGSGLHSSYRLRPTLPGPGDTLWSFPCPGPLCNGLAWDGEHFWVSSADSERLYRLGSDGNVEDTFSLPTGVVFPAGLTWDGAHLWMVEEQQARAYELDTATGSALRSIRLPDSSSGDPNSWGLAWDGHYLWHNDYTGTGHIYQLDTVSGSVVSQFTPPNSHILAIAWDGTFLWGLSAANSSTAYKMNVPSGTVVDSLAWQVRNPLGLLWDGNFFWNISGFAHRVYKVGGGNDISEDRRTAAYQRSLMSPPAPNPLTRWTRISCSVPAGLSADVGVFDAGGRLIRRLALDSRGVLMWDGTDDSGRPAVSGVHLIRMRLSDGTSEQHPVLLVR
jgi:hypothetical protein